jgi:hypothetical protein
VRVASGCTGVDSGDATANIHSKNINAKGTTCMLSMMLARPGLVVHLLCIIVLESAFLLRASANQRVSERERETERERERKQGSEAHRDVRNER